MSGKGTLTREQLREEVAAIMEANHTEPTEVGGEAPQNQAADDAQGAPVTAGGTETNEKVDKLEQDNKALSERIRHFEVKELTRERSDALKDAGLSDEQVKARVAQVVAMDEDAFKLYLDDVRDLVSASKQSADEGGSGDSAQAATDDESDAGDEAEAGKATASEDEDDEDISLDLGKINQVDADVPVKSNSSAGGADGAGSLVDRFEKALAPVLIEQNPKVFGGLAKK